MMIVATVDKKEEKRIDHVVHATISQVSTKAFLPWSEKDISWTQKDHPKVVKEPGRLPLVVAPQINGYRLSKVLMDGGSGINILHLDAFERLKLDLSKLNPTKTTFHSIVPGKSAT